MSGETNEGGEKAGFRVIDRRRFDAEGAERAAAGEASAPRAEGATGTGGTGADFVLADPPAGSNAGPTAPEVTISALFLSLSTTALVHLGEIPDHATGRTEKDLPAARGMIDLLALLGDKTKGNLDPEEARLLDRILYDLRMRYVELARS